MIDSSHVVHCKALGIPTSFWCSSSDRQTHKRFQQTTSRRTRHLKLATPFQLMKSVKTKVTSDQLATCSGHAINHIPPRQTILKMSFPHCNMDSELLWSSGRYYTWLICRTVYLTSVQCVFVICQTQQSWAVIKELFRYQHEFFLHLIGPIGLNNAEAKIYHRPLLFWSVLASFSSLFCYLGRQ